MRKKFISFISFLIFIFLCALVALFWSTHNAHTGTLKFPELSGPVSVHWDDYGVPHIFAEKSDNDAYFVLGYLHAQDRMWQMEFQRRVGRGTLSEIFGPVTLEKDKFLRTFSFYHFAEQSWQYLDERSKAILTSYSQGVNAFLREGKLPLEFKLLHIKPEPWTTTDSQVWQKLMAFDLQTAWVQKINHYLAMNAVGLDQLPILFPAYPLNGPFTLSNADLQQTKLNQGQQTALNQQLKQLQAQIIEVKHALNLPENQGLGSNSWVVSGALTKSHKPLLASDPHLGLQAPAIWYLTEIKGPTLHVTGASIPGLPSVAIGHNDDIAWGVTNIDPNSQDLYIEAPNVRLVERDEVIKVKNQADVHWPVYESQHGIIISQVSKAAEKLGPLVALRWTAFLPNDTTLKSFLDINYAHNWQEFSKAISYFVVPGQNFTYADKDGNIGYYASGLVPIRSGNYSAAFPILPDQNVEWVGYIPSEQMPHVYNPPENKIVTANNAITPPDYPYQLTFRWKEPPFRAERILALLGDRTDLTAADFQHMQMDRLSTLWLFLKPTLLSTQPLDTASRQALNQLQAWDGELTLESKAASIFGLWYQQLQQMAVPKLPFASAWNEPLFIQQQLANQGPYCRIHDKDCAAYLSHTLQQALQSFHTIPVWGKLHYAEFKALGVGESKWLGWLWNRRIATEGGLYTVNVGSYPDHKFVQTKGPGYRQVVDLADENNNVFIQTLGQSGNPFDFNYDNLMSLWRNGEYLPMTLRKEGGIQKFIPND